MVLTSDVNSAIGAHVRRNFSYLSYQGIWLDREKSEIYFFSGKTYFFLYMRYILFWVTIQYTDHGLYKVVNPGPIYIPREDNDTARDIPKSIHYTKFSHYGCLPQLKGQFTK